MKFFLIILLSVWGVAHDALAQENKKQENKKVEITPEEKAFLKELEKIKDPFVSPFAKKAVVEEVKPPQPIEIVKPPVPVKLPDPIPTPPPPRPVPTPVALPIPAIDKGPAFSTGGIKVNGIIWNTDFPQAIVNDSVVSVGEDLQGAKIMAIKKEGIELMHNGKKYYLTITDKPVEPTSNVNRNPFAGARRATNEKF